MIKLRTALAVGALAAALAGCSGSPPATSTVAHSQRTETRQACVLLAATTRAASQGAPAFLGTATDTISNLAATGGFTPTFRRDVMAVIGTIYLPAPAAVRKLGADCKTAGVKGPVWPAAMTGLG